MDIRLIPVGKINPAPYNPRKDLKPGDPEYEKIKRSIEEFGLVEPLVWNKRSGNLVGGHQRFKVQLEMGKEEVPVSVVDLDEYSEKALNLALNKVAGEWDMPKLQELLQEMDESGFDMDLIGFDKAELDELMEEYFPESRGPAAPIEYETEFKLEPEIIEEIMEKEVFITFSGGKDSSVATFLMIPILRELGKEFELVFVDTGVEIPTVSEYVIRFAEHFGCDLHIVRSGVDFFSYYERKKSWPNAIYRDCIAVLIKDPAERYMIDKAGDGKEIINIRGGRSVQATDLSKGQKFYTVKQGARDIRLLNPLYDLSEEAFERYRQQLEDEFGLWEGYAKGFQRTACWCCPFQTVQQYDVIKQELPLCWEVLERKAQEWTFQGATHLDRYLNRPRRSKNEKSRD